MKFRRATHDRDGNYRADLEAEALKPTPEQKTYHVWQEAGNVCHALTSSRGMSFYELCEGIQRDTTNYRLPGAVNPTHPNDDRSPVPSREEIGLKLVYLIEAGLVEVVDE